VGHVVPGLPLRRVKERLSLVRGSIVEAPLVRCPFDLHSIRSTLGPILNRFESQDFLIDEKDFVEGPEWSKLNPTLAVYI
jgi:phospholipase D1/2